MFPNDPPEIRWNIEIKAKDSVTIILHDISGDDIHYNKELGFLDVSFKSQGKESAYVVPLSSIIYILYKGV